MATMTEPRRQPKIHQNQCFIGGQWQPSVSGKTFETINPATEEVILQVAEGDAADIDLAVAAAREDERSKTVLGAEWMPGIVAG